MEAGWLDYILPQLYFNIGYPAADFTVLAEWWRDYSAGTPVYGGLGTYRLDAGSKIEAWRSPLEIKKQALMLREMNNYQGACYFSAKNMKDNKLDINSVLRELYPNPTIVPQMRGFETNPPVSPEGALMSIKGGDILFKWQGEDLPKGNASLEKCNSERAYYYLIYKFKKGETPDFSKGSSILALTGETKYSADAAQAQAYDFYVSALDRLYNESKAVKFNAIK